jgi:biopolymer transport protein ExbB
MVVKKIIMMRLKTAIAFRKKCFLPPLLFSLMYCCNPIKAQPPGYAYGKSITIQSSMVSGTVTNFPVLISITDNNLRTIANGGHVAHANGYDIVFTLPNGSTQLSHQIERYVPATGEYVAWVNVPSLSSSSNTIIAMFYGNASVSADPSNTAVWDNDYMGVWHFNNSVQDATSHARNLIDASTANFSGSKIGDGRQLNNTPFVASSSGSCKYLQFGPLLSGVTGFTFEGWVYVDNNTTNWERIFDFGSNTTSYMFLSPSVGTTGVKRFAITTTGNGGEQVVSSATTTGTGAWHHFAVSIDNSNNNAILYFDGAADNTNPGVTLRPTNIAPDNTNFFGRSHFGSDHCLYGKLDEFRISNAVRNGNWIQTSYNNQHNPSSFYTMGSELTASALVALLPVTWRSFKGIANPEGNVTLTWTTEQEINHEKFILERSGNGIQWAAIQTIPATIPGSANPHSYTARDEHPVYPVSWYRLQQVDVDGSRVYSPVIVIPLNKSQQNNNDILLHPNPAQNRVKISLQKGIFMQLPRVELLNSTGNNIMLKGRLHGNVLEIETSGLVTGIYWLTIYTNSYRYTRKLLIAR